MTAIDLTALSLDELSSLLNAITAEIDRRNAAPVRVTRSFGSYNGRRYSKPWIALVTSWPVGGRAELVFGSYLGDNYGGEAEIMARPGDIVRWGQKDTRNPKYTTAEWGKVCEDGSIENLTMAEARKAYQGK